MKTKLAFSCMVALMSVMLISTASAGALAVGGGPSGAPTGVNPNIEAGISLCGAGQIYCNGPGASGNAGNVDAWTIGFSFSITDSFTVGSSTATGADIAVWQAAGANDLTNVTWEICTSQSGGVCTGTNLGSGTAGVTSVTNFGTNNYGYDVQEYSFSVGSIPLGAGTYWLELSNASSVSGDPIYWDENSGSSLAFENSVGSIPSESFAILGTTSGGGVPEPGTLALFGSGVLLLGGLLRRKLR